MKRLRHFFSELEKFANRKWYVYFISILAAVDAFVVFIPNEGLLISAVIASPKAWIKIAFGMSVGSAIGAAIFGFLMGQYGEALINLLFPSLLTSESWRKSAQLLRHHGLWGLAVISFSPLPQHAAVAIAGLIHLSFWKIFLAVLVGRILKYFLFAWIAVRAPHLLHKMRIKRLH